MPSLDEAYGRARSPRDPRRVVVALALGGVGAVAVLVAIGFAALGGSVERTVWAGTLAGLGVPAMFLAVVFVLPARLRTRLGVVAGSVLTLAGVLLFRTAYPGRWTRAPDSLAFETVMVYGVGAAVALWFVFVAIATFRRRNDPQGTVELEVVRQGETRTVEVSREQYRTITSDGGDASRVIRELDDNG